MFSVHNLLLAILLLGYISSCGSRGIKWDPDFYVGDSLSGGIVNEDNDFVSAYDERFNRFSCLSEAKVKELAEILTTKKAPKALKRETKRSLNQIENAKRNRR